MVAQQQNLRMPSAHQQTDERELRHHTVVRLLDKVRQDMCLQVVHLYQRDTQCLGKALGKRHPHHQRTQQAGTPGERHRTDVAPRHAGIAYRRIHHGHDILLMGTRCQLGHHATVLLMHLLRGYHIAQQSVATKHSGRRIVARRLDRQYNWLIHISNPL